MTDQPPTPSARQELTDEIKTALLEYWSNATRVSLARDKLVSIAEAYAENMAREREVEALKEIKDRFIDDMMIPGNVLYHYGKRYKVSFEEAPELKQKGQIDE